MVKQSEAGNNVSKVRAYSVAPVKEPAFQETIKVSSERELITVARQLAARLSDQPEFSVMLFANPVLAMRSYGVELTKELEHHVLTSLRHPPELRQRRAELSDKIEKELCETPKPTDPEWLADLVFTKRKLKPRDIAKLEPVYKPALSQKRVAAIRARRPKQTKRYPQTRRIKVRHSMGVAESKNTIRRLDLDAELPDLPASQDRPKALTIEQAWFYKDDPIVRDVVELGAIMQRGFPFATPDEFRKIAKGESANAFRTFIKTVGVAQAEKPEPKKVTRAAKPKAKPKPAARKTPSKAKPKTKPK